MQAILSVTVPFFALVLIGYVAAHRRLLPESAVPGLNAYVLYFALPCLLYRFGSATPFAQLLDPSLLGVYGSSALLMVFFSIAMTLQRPGRGGHGRNGVPLKDAAFGALVAAFPNTGFMGVPLLVALLGERAAGPVVATVLTDLFLTSSLCIAIAQTQAERALDAYRLSHANDRSTIPGESLGDALDNALDDSAGLPEPRPDLLGGSIVRSVRSALSNPLPWAIGAGALTSVTGWELPGPAAYVANMLADSATPVALFTIGAMLQRSRSLSPSRSRARAGWSARAIGSTDAIGISLFKLILHPLVVLSFGAIAHALGVPLTPFGLTVLILAAALPSASNVSLLTERYGADTGRVARIILISTALASVTFPALAWVLVEWRP